MTWVFIGSRVVQGGDWNSRQSDCSVALTLNTDSSVSLLDTGVSFRLQYQATLSSLILLKICTLKSHTTV